MSIRSSFEDCNVQNYLTYCNGGAIHRLRIVMNISYRIKFDMMPLFVYSATDEQHEQ